MVYGEKVEILQFKPWLNKVYESFPNGFQNVNLNKDETRQSISKGIQTSRSFPNISQANTLEARTRISATDEHAPIRSQGFIKVQEQIPVWRRIINRISGLRANTPPSPVRLDQQQWPAKRFLRSQWFCERATSRSSLENHCLINIEYDKVIFSGEGQMYMGQLTWDKQNVRWKRLRKIPGTRRCDYMIFKMKEYVYVIGGYEDDTAAFNIEKYNLKRKEWSICRHKLPLPLKDASIVVSQDESYAVITGGFIGENGFTEYWNILTIWIIVFEEETGFTLLKDQMLRRRNNHVSIAIS